LGRKGTAVTFTATVQTVAPGVGTLTGEVEFRDGTTSLGKVKLTNGQARMTFIFSVPGKHSITAVYTSDPDFLGSISVAVPVSIV
jgi:hypothetical protein